jgi:hypothetical protein
MALDLFSSNGREIGIEADWLKARRSVIGSIVKYKGTSFPTMTTGIKPKI